MRVYEIFKSIQGEGKDIGRLASFVRFSGCPFECKFCDTQEAKVEGFEIEIDDIIERLKNFNLKDVVVTGGEPLHQKDIDKFIIELSKQDWVRKIFIETCGIYYVEEIFTPKVYLNISPKPPSMGVRFPENELILYLKNFPSKVNVKFLVAFDDDLLHLKEFLKKHGEFFKYREIVIQPIEFVDEPYDETVKRVIDMVYASYKDFEDYEIKIIPQIHKLLGIK